MSILEVKDLKYSYENNKPVIRGINAKMEQGKMYAILGPSGCGKTTLLSLLGGLDNPTNGRTLQRLALPLIGAIMFLLSFRATT